MIPTDEDLRIFAVFFSIKKKKNIEERNEWRKNKAISLMAFKYLLFAASSSTKR